MQSCQPTTPLAIGSTLKEVPLATVYPRQRSEGAEISSPQRCVACHARQRALPPLLTACRGKQQRDTFMLLAIVLDHESDDVIIR